MEYSLYRKIQLKTASNRLFDCMEEKRDEIKKRRGSNVLPPLYSSEEIKNIIGECESLIATMPEAGIFWNDESKKELEGFLKELCLGDYKTSEESYLGGKSRGYNSHVEWFCSHFKSKESVLIDLAGRSGYASSVMKYLGFQDSYTVEFSPLNVIISRYIYGRNYVYQGDAHYLSQVNIEGVDLSAGNSVDGIFCRYSLEHFIYIEKVFNEVYHVLKPGGMIGIIVGHGMGKALDHGDVQFFPDAASIYKYARNLAFVEYKLQKINGGKSYEHLALFIKPEDNSMPTPEKYDITLRKRLRSFVVKRPA